MLTGCHNNLAVACNYIADDKSITLDINAINDEISSIGVRTCFEIPQKVMCDEDKINFIKGQLDSSYHFEDNLLIREYAIVLDDVYSLDKTIQYLKTQRFYCE